MRGGSPALHPLMMAALARVEAFIQRSLWFAALHIHHPTSQARERVTHSVFHHTALIYRLFSSELVPSGKINSHRVCWCRLIPDDGRIRNNSARRVFTVWRAAMLLWSGGCQWVDSQRAESFTSPSCDKTDLIRSFLRGCRQPNHWNKWIAVLRRLSLVTSRV